MKTSTVGSVGLSVIAFSMLALLGGCPKKSITIYRSLSEPGAMKTCDANTRFRVEQKGKDAAEAKEKAEAEIRSVIATNKGCGAFITNEGSGKTLDGPINHVADFQLCKCN
jgi:hypothetical protein